MHIIGEIIIGFIVGLIARFVKPGNDHMGLAMTTLIGILGAFVGHFLGQLLGLYSSNEPAGFIGSILGAVIVLTLIKSYTTRKHITH